MDNATSTLVKKGIREEDNICSGIVAGVDGFIYGIPYFAHKVVKFNLSRQQINNQSLAPDLTSVMVDSMIVG